MGQFFMGIFTGIVTEIIIFLFVKSVKNKKLRRKFVKAISGNDFIPYKNQKEALCSIKTDVEHSNHIRVLSLRGLSFLNSDGDFNFIWNDGKEIEMILSNIRNEAIKKRVKLHKNTDYWEEMRYVHNALKNKKKNYQDLSYYIHSVDLAFRIILLDTCVYVSYINDDLEVPKSQIYKFDSTTEIYQAFNKYYKSVRAYSSKKIF